MPAHDSGKPVPGARNRRALHWQRTMAKPKLDGEVRVMEYLAGAGLRVERFSKAEMRHGRTPDFRVFGGDVFAFYCEVKTAQEDEWLDKQFAASTLVPVGGSRQDPTYNRISSYVHSAVGQFDAVNPGMDCPNVVAIVNGDEGAAFPDLLSVLTGDAYGASGEIIPMFREYSDGRIGAEKARVHLYLWFDDWRPGKPQMFFPGAHPEHHAALCRFLGVDPAALKLLPYRK